MNPSGFLHDNKGKASHARLLVMLCVPILVMAPICIWIYLCIAHAAMVSIDPTVPLYIGTANGIILGYAGYNKNQESKPTPPAPTP